MHVRAIASCVTVIVGLSASLASIAAPADLLKAKGTQATLTVEYSYESAGNKPDKDNPEEWRVKRTVSLVADLVAEGPAPFPAMHAMEAGQTATIGKQQAKIESAGKAMAPMMADMEKIAERCGDDDACVERAIAQYAQGLTMTPEMQATQKDAASMAAMGAPRYQLWGATTQRGTFAIDEYFHRQDSDPICESHANKRCRRHETRKGGGEVPLPPSHKKGKPAPSVARIEVDSGKGTMMLLLPAPLNALPYNYEIQDDKPGRTNASGTQYSRFRTGTDKPFLVPLNGALSPQSGTQKIPLSDSGVGENGTVTVRWQLGLVSGGA